jgi:hypothetical protein
LEREVFFAGEEAKEGAAFVRVVFTDGAGEHRITGFEGVEDGADGYGRRNVEGNFAVDVRESAQMVRELDADEGGVRHGF